MAVFVSTSTEKLNGQSYDHKCMTQQHKNLYLNEVCLGSLKCLHGETGKRNRKRPIPLLPLQTESEFVLTSMCVIIGIGMTDGDRYCRANEDDAEAVIADCLRNHF